MPDSTDLAPLIRGLSDAAPARRAGAAAEIVRFGNELARAATQQWLADAQLAACLVRGRDGAAEVTVGVAVEPDSFERIRAASGLPRLADVPPDQDAKEFELDFPNGARLDVLTTREPGGSGAMGSPTFNPATSANCTCAVYSFEVIERPVSQNIAIVNAMRPKMTMRPTLTSCLYALSIFALVSLVLDHGHLQVALQELLHRAVARGENLLRRPHRPDLGLPQQRDPVRHPK